MHPMRSPRKRLKRVGSATLLGEADTTRRLRVLLQINATNKLGKNEIRAALRLWLRLASHPHAGNAPAGAQFQREMREIDQEHDLACVDHDDLNVVRKVRKAWQRYQQESPVSPGRRARAQASAVLEDGRRKLAARHAERNGEWCMSVGALPQTRAASPIVSPAGPRLTPRATHVVAAIGAGTAEVDAHDLARALTDCC